MNYKDFGQGKRIDAEKLEKLANASAPTELCDIASWQNFFRNDVLVGLVCADKRFRERDNLERTLFVKGNVLAPVNRSLITKKKNGLYSIEGVKVPYLIWLNYQEKAQQIFPYVWAEGGGYNTPEPFSQLALPTDKFIPLYMNLQESLGILPPPAEFGRVD